jgi:hypothetical protein
MLSSMSIVEFCALLFCVKEMMNNYIFYIEQYVTMSYL